MKKIVLLLKIQCENEIQINIETAKKWNISIFCNWINLNEKNCNVHCGNSSSNPQ